MHKLCFIDVETTGLDAKLNGIIQIAGQIVFGQNTEYDVIETFNFSVQPFTFDKIDQRALDVNGVTQNQLSQYKTPKEIFPEFLAVLNRHCEKNNPADKYFFVGFNAKFDDDFLRAFFDKIGNKEYSKFFYRPALDVMQLALFTLREERASMPNFKLATVSQFLNIQAEGNLHNAMTDILLTKGIYFHCINLLK